MNGYVFGLIRILRIFRVMSFSVESYGFRRNVSWVRQIVTEGGCGGQNGYEKKYGWMLAVFFFPSCSLGCSVLPLAGDSYGARALSCFSPENLSSSIKIRFSRMNLTFLTLQTLLFAQRDHAHVEFFELFSRDRSRSLRH